jgi:hypothetical protein
VPASERLAQVRPSDCSWIGRVLLRGLAAATIPGPLTSSRIKPRHTALMSTHGRLARHVTTGRRKFVRKLCVCNVNMTIRVDPRQPVFRVGGRCAICGAEISEYCMDGAAVAPLQRVPPPCRSVAVQDRETVSPGDPRWDVRKQDGGGGCAAAGRCALQRHVCSAEISMTWWR